MCKFNCLRDAEVMREKQKKKEELAAAKKNGK